MANGVRFIRVRGRVVPIRDNSSKLKSTGAALVGSGVAVAAYGESVIGHGVRKFGMKANEFLSQVHDLRKEGTRLADAASQFRGSPSSKGAEIAKGFAKSSANAFRKAGIYERSGMTLGKVSSHLAKIRKKSLGIGLGLIGTGALLSIYANRKSKK